MRYLFGVATMLVIVSGVLLAQSNEPIEECSKSLAIVAVVAISTDDFISDYGDLFALINEGNAMKTPSVAQATLQTVVELRERYYADVQPAMPDCAGSLRAQLAFSDSFSELTMMLAAGNLLNAPGDDYDYFGELAETIGTRFAEATQDLLKALQELQELSGL